MPWDTITGWVEEHLGRPVSVTLTQAEPDGHMSAEMVTSGILGYSDGEWTVIDPAPGRALACSVGDAHILILEGAVEDAEFDDPALFIELAGGNLQFAPATAAAARGA